MLQGPLRSINVPLLFDLSLGTSTGWRQQSMRCRHQVILKPARSARGLSTFNVEQGDVAAGGRWDPWERENCPPPAHRWVGGAATAGDYRAARGGIVQFATTYADSAHRRLADPTIRVCLPSMLAYACGAWDSSLRVMWELSMDLTALLGAMSSRSACRRVPSCGHPE